MAPLAREATAHRRCPHPKHRDRLGVLVIDLRPVAVVGLVAERRRHHHLCQRHKCSLRLLTHEVRIRHRRHV